MSYYQSLICFGLIALLLPSDAKSQSSWLQWRGPTGNGIAAPDQTPPVKWDYDKNILWRTKVPGRGHASPTIVGNKILLATSRDPNMQQSVICFDRKDGKTLWETVLSEGGFPKTIHVQNTHASPTVASDGSRVFAVFHHHEEVHVYALDLNGKKVWQKVVGKYRPKFPFGFGQSPIVDGRQVIVSSDNEADSQIVAYDCESGKIKWKIKRPKTTSYSTPVVANVGGRRQLLIGGGGKVRSYDPTNGKLIWESPARWKTTCGSVVWDAKNNMVFLSGAYPKGHTLGLKADSGRKVWDNNVQLYEQSLLCVDGHVYGVNEGGIAHCWNAADGKLMWKQRLGGPESASLVCAGGNIYHTARDGTVYVFKANPKQFEAVGENQLGDSAYATPAFVDNQIFHRVGDSSDGDRQEWLYCIDSR